MKREQTSTQIVAIGCFAILLALLLIDSARGQTVSIRGTLAFPQASTTTRSWLTPRHDPIHVSLERIDGDGRLGQPIVDQPTWIVIHGRSSDAKDFYSLAAAIAARQPEYQVLLLDWSEGAADNFPTGLNGAEWIPVVADWAYETLKAQGLAGQQISLLGHSWGAYVAYDIASAWTDGTHRGVHSIIALDPASAGIGLSLHALKLSAVADHSWAFFDNDACGSAEFALTADECFDLVFDQNISSIARHWACVPVLEQLLRGDDAVSRLFSVSRLQSALAAPWTAEHEAEQPTTSPRTFAATLVLGPSVDGLWDLVRGLTYNAAGTEVHLPIAARG